MVCTAGVRGREGSYAEAQAHASLAGNMAHDQGVGTCPPRGAPVLKPGFGHLWVL